MAVIYGVVISLAIVNIVVVIFLYLRIRREDGRVDNSFKKIEDAQDKLHRFIREDTSLSRSEINSYLTDIRKEINSLFKSMQDSIILQISSLMQINEQKLEQIRNAVNNQLNSLKEENTRELDRMRNVVDDNLHAVLEKRLGESFKIVSERLESVYKGLGEMQTLASDVGDLKKVLTNVKMRGTWGEIQLGILLDQILSPEQYDKNVVTNPASSERVEFAVKLPGQDKSYNNPLWLPIDAKFPQEDYQRLLQYQDTGNAEAAERERKHLEMRIKSEAAAIKEKYLNPPYTTDFGILYLPTEGLYAEVLRIPGLWDILQRKFRIIITGPTTLAALLNSLQVGFKTLAIQKRSGQIWQLLGIIRNEFNKFGSMLDKTKKKLQEAANTIENASSKTRNIQRKLDKMQQIPIESTKVYGEHSFLTGIDNED